MIPAVNGPIERAALHEAVLWHDRCRDAEARVAVLEQQIAAYGRALREVQQLVGYGQHHDVSEAVDIARRALAAGVVDNPTEDEANADPFTLDDLGHPTEGSQS